MFVLIIVPVPYILLHLFPKVSTQQKSSKEKIETAMSCPRRNNPRDNPNETITTALFFISGS
jgi:hypothetical protein